MYHEIHNVYIFQHQIHNSIVISKQKTSLSPVFYNKLVNDFKKLDWKRLKTLNTLSSLVYLQSFFRSPFFRGRFPFSIKPYLLLWLLRFLNLPHGLSNGSIMNRHILLTRNKKDEIHENGNMRTEYFHQKPNCLLDIRASSEPARNITIRYWEVYTHLLRTLNKKECHRWVTRIMMQPLENLHLQAVGTQMQTESYTKTF